MADLISSQQFAAKVRAKYPGAYDSLGDDELTNRVIEKHPEYRSVVQSPPITSGNPTAMANRALELSSPGRGLQVSGKEQNPRVQAPKVEGNSAPVAGAISTALDVGEGLKQQAQPGNLARSAALYGNPITAGPAVAKNALYDIPKAAGEHIAGSINAFRGEDPNEGFRQAYEGAGDTAMALAPAAGIPKVGPTVSEAAAPMIRGAVKTANYGLRHTPEIAGSIMGAELSKATGIPMWIGGGAGWRVGKALGGKMWQLPGENFGLRTVEPAGPSVSDFSFGQKPASVPSGPTAEAPFTIPGRIPPKGPSPESFSFGQKASPLPGGPTRAASSTRPEIGAPSTPTAFTAAPEAAEGIPSPNDVAQGMGFKNATQAIGRLGPQGWQDTYNKVIGAPEKAPEGIKTPNPFSPTQYPFEGKQETLPPLQRSHEINPAEDSLEDLAIREAMREDLEHHGQRAAKEAFYAQAPELKTKTQLTNEPVGSNRPAAPAIVAKSEKRRR